MKDIVSKRIGAYVLDVFFIYILISMIAGIRIINPQYDKYMNYYEEYNKVVNKYKEKEIDAKELVKLNSNNFYYMSKYSVSTNIAAIVVLIGYFVLFQKYNNGQTLGKKIMKIKVVNKDLDNPSIGQYLLRIIPYYYLLIGNVLAIIINSIAIFFVKSNTYVKIEAITTYVSFAIGIISLIMLLKKGHIAFHDKITGTRVVDE
jgi:uncharacterized RDD family membrane protein YckC